MRKLIAVALCATAAVVVVPPHTVSSAVTIRVGDSSMRPGVVNISRGELVRFRFVGRRSHGVTKRHGPGGRIRSRTMRRGTFRVRLRRRGTYHFVCTRHGSRHQTYVRVR